MDTKNNSESWKEKAVERGHIIKAISKRNVEIIEGRENWKSKFKKIKQERDDLKKELENIKKKIENILK